MTDPDLYGLFDMGEPEPIAWPYVVGAVAALIVWGFAAVGAWTVCGWLF